MHGRNDGAQFDLLGHVDTAVFVEDRVGDVDPVGCHAHLPRHTIGVTRPRGVLVRSAAVARFLTSLAIWPAMLSWLMCGQSATGSPVDAAGRTAAGAADAASNTASIARAASASAAPNALSAPCNRRVSSAARSSSIALAAESDPPLQTTNSADGSDGGPTVPSSATGQPSARASASTASTRSRPRPMTSARRELRRRPGSAPGTSGAIPRW